MPLTMFFDVSIEKGKEKEVVFFLIFSHEVWYFGGFPLPAPFKT